jgi:hypothetical protein
MARKAVRIAEGMIAAVPAQGGDGRLGHGLNSRPQACC